MLATPPIVARKPANSDASPTARAAESAASLLFQATPGDEIDALGRVAGGRQLRPGEKAWQRADLVEREPAFMIGAGRVVYLIGDDFEAMVLHAMLLFCVMQHGRYATAADTFCQGAALRMAS